MMHLKQFRFRLRPLCSLGMCPQLLMDGKLTGCHFRTGQTAEETHLYLSRESNRDSFVILPVT